MPNLFPLSALLILLFNISSTSLPTLPEATVSAHAGLLNEKKENAEFIPWVTERPLTWHDFQCAPKRNSDAVASTSTSLGIAYHIKNYVLTYEITCNFSKTKSWGLVKTPYILAHEQAHFDITEIFARKLHQSLMEYEFDQRTYKKDINTIYQQIVAEKEAFQEAYDKETDHSRNKRVQYEWLERIDNILVETEPFADYP
jgi:Bacterial protein of unknown function (DUF922)